MTRSPAKLRLRTPAPLVRLLLTLSATTGMVDAAGILGMERVFLANMAGNLVFAALAAARAPGFALVPCLAALGAFAAGAVVAGWTGRRLAGDAERPGHWLVRAAVLESALLILAGLLALWLERAGALPGRAVLAVIVLTAGATGFCSTVVRKLGVPGLAAGSEEAAIGGASRTIRPGAAAVTFAGAAGGAVLVMAAGPGTTLLAAGLIALAATVLFVRRQHMSEVERP